MSLPELRKNWWASKTLWVAFIDLFLLISSELFADPSIAEQIKHTSAGLLPVIMVILRFLTKEPLIR